MQEVDPSILDGLTPDEKLELLQLLEKQDRKVRENRLALYKPNKRQREFHAMGAFKRERIFMAANQTGKTMSASAETAMHLTGLYPDWWDGFRFQRAIRATAIAESGELTRKGVQRLLVGTPEDEAAYGTGFIPKHTLVSWLRKPGVPNALATITVKHVCGDNSVLQFNSSDQGRTRLQADTLDLVFLDEEAPEEIYTESLTRTNTTGGIVYTTFTPLKGETALVRRFTKGEFPDTGIVRMTIDDVDHLTPEQIATIKASYPEHEREARINGVPMLGSGGVFPIAQSEITCEPFPIPASWPRLGAIDPGSDHPAGFAYIAYDVNTDTIYCYDSWRKRRSSVAELAMIIQAKGYSRQPHSWPTDMGARQLATGTQLKAEFERFGVNMLPIRAQMEKVTRNDDTKQSVVSVEASLSHMLVRFQTGRLKIFSNQLDLLEEIRSLHRVDGQVVKLHDDIVSALRYAVMMVRYAEAPAQYDPERSAFPALHDLGWAPLDPVAGY